MPLPFRTIVQENGRIRRWALIAEVGKYLRVVTESDGETVHNAFFDRRKVSIGLGQLLQKFKVEHWTVDPAVAWVG